MAINATVLYIEFVPPPPLATGLSDWRKVGDTTYLTTADVATPGDDITDPAAQITQGSRQIFTRGFTPASFLGIRMGYDQKPITTNPIIKVFGRSRMPYGAAGGWQILRNRLGDADVTLVADPSDIEDLVFGFVTTPDQEQHYFDVHGCNEFLIGVQVAADGFNTECGIEVRFL